MKRLLALVDLQSAYLTAPRLEPTSGAIVARTSALLEACRSRGIPVAHIRTASPEGFDVRRLRDGAGLRPQAGTPEYAPPAELKELPDECVIHKSGYSAFLSDDTERLIRQLDIETILIAGVHLHSCVRQTALAARERGLRVWIADDAVASDDPVHAALTRRYLEDRLVRFGSVTRIIADLNDPGSAVETHLQGTTVDEAVSRASCFGATWRRTDESRRIELIHSLADELERSAPQLADAVTEEVGKPIRFSTLEAQRSPEMLRAIAQHAQLELHSPGPADTAIRRRPLGTVAIITPFNNPAYLPLGKIVPAVLFGNTVVWKPAPEALRVSRYLIELMSAAGWPEGLVTLTEGDARAGRSLVNHPRVDAITMTGSSSAGFSAQVAAAERRIPLQAELGGNNAAIVWHDADVPVAAEAVAAGAFEMSGQRCTANRRVIVHEKVAEMFLNGLIDAARRLPCGSPWDPRTRVGPLVTTERRQIVADMVQRAERNLGASVYSGGEPSGLDRHAADRWFPPTILCCDDPEYEIVQEETFGPVLVVQVAGSWEEAIALCNRVRQGLVAAIFTTSADTARRFLDEACAGILKVNQSTADASVDVPFGGWKMSGIGPPEHGIFDREYFTRPQTIYTRGFEGRL